MKEGEKVRERWGRRARATEKVRGRSKEREIDGEREKRKPGLIASGMGPPGGRKGPSHLVGCSLVPTDALSLCTHSHTHMLRESIQGWASVTPYTSMLPCARRCTGGATRV